MIIPEPLKIYAYAAAGVAIFAFGAASAWTIQGYRLDAVNAEFKLFVGTTEAIGKQAQIEAESKAKTDKMNKEKADHENQIARAALLADIKRLRNINAGKGNLSAPASSASSPDRICFDQAKLDGALRSLDAGILGILEIGSKAVIDLDSAKQWAKTVYDN